MKIFLGNSLEVLQEIQKPDCAMVLKEGLDDSPRDCMSGFSVSKREEYEYLLGLSILNGKILGHSPAKRIRVLGDTVRLSYRQGRDDTFPFDELHVYNVEYLKTSAQFLPRYYGATIYDIFSSDKRLPTESLQKHWPGKLWYRKKRWEYSSEIRLHVKTSLRANDKWSVRFQLEDLIHRFMKSPAKLENRERFVKKHYRVENLNENVYIHVDENWAHSLSKP